MSLMLNEMLMNGGSTVNISQLGASWGSAEIFDIYFSSDTGTWLLGDNSAKFVASTGGTWVSKGTLLGNPLGMHNANGMWIIVGIGGNARRTNNIFGSGTNFTIGTSNLNSVHYGNGLWVIVGDGGVIRTSTDGITWTARTSGTTNNIYDVFYNTTNNLWMAVGQAYCRTSPDGITWTSRNTADIYRGVSYGNGLWVIVGDAGGIRTSPDGITWTVRLALAALEDVHYGSGVFVAVGNLNIRVSTDGGITWVSKTGATDNLHAVGYNPIDNFWLAAGQNGSIILSSNNGSTWS